MYNHGFLGSLLPSSFCTPVFQFSFQQAKSPSPVYSTKGKKENPHTKTENLTITTHWGTFISPPPPPNTRKLESSENILGKTNTTEAGLKSEIINFYTKS